MRDDTMTASGAKCLTIHKKEKAAGRNDMRSICRRKSRFYLSAKRLADIVLSCIALTGLSPVFLICALAIKLEDGGPVFFTQLRAGKDARPFRIYKFRSMHVNADESFREMMKYNEQTGQAFKIKEDPRITRVGRVIRRLSIDELPQLVNIIKGDMSIVGPRPLLVFQMEECNEYQKQRLLVSPGLTCYWQISGRADVKWDEWVEMDLDYIEDMSLWTDLKIIARTIPAIVSGDGAY